MLTSLKVVSIAAVDCDCTSRSAMRARSRDIRTRRSGRSPVAAGGADSAFAGGLEGAGWGGRREIREMGLREVRELQEV